MALEFTNLQLRVVESLTRLTNGSSTRFPSGQQALFLAPTLATTLTGCGFGFFGCYFSHPEDDGTSQVLQMVEGKNASIGRSSTENVYTRLRRVALTDRTAEGSAPSLKIFRYSFILVCTWCNLGNDQGPFRLGKEQQSSSPWDS
jgi:hypothetical protein